MNGVKLYFVVAVAVFLALGSMATAAGVRSVTTTIESQTNNVGVADDVNVRITYRNDSAEDVYLLRWQTALQGIEGNLFEVRVDGQPVPYTGRLYKRGTPQASDYIRIPAGGSRSADVELTQVYDFSRTGEYTLRYKVAVQDALRADGFAKVAGLDELRSLESNVLFLGVERNERNQRAIAAIETLVQIDEAARIGTKALAPSYVSCSSSRQNSLVTALSNAQAISLKARDYLNNLPTASRSTDAAYKTWFGAYTSSRYSGVQSDYVNLYSTFVNQAFTFYCDCTDSSYAYVFANQPYKVHLCGAFWNAPSLGIDSKAGTLVHETSHFTVVAGTQDYAYGQTACKSLATSNPAHAVHNADSHEYFAETR
ncbi:MAG TPA: M35 family metallo-endopeptidase [Thermoanaerobaculia bacterium]|nr:M35 family metallo-endopeptidase [Thermoanaerobaculia bacterium]